MDKNHFILYGTADCHLCEEATKLIRQIDADLKLSIVDIMDDDELFTRYEFSIPVLKSNVTGAEIHWPFSIKAISLFLSTNQ